MILITAHGSEELAVQALRARATNYVSKQAIATDLTEERRRLQPYRHGRIELVARIERQSATYVINDEGPGFDTSRLDQPIEPEDLLRVGGRGLLLIRAFKDDVSYNDAGNRITMIKRGRMKSGN